MKITIETFDDAEVEKLFWLLKSLKIDVVNVASLVDNTIPLIQGDKNADPASLFGIWKDKPRTLKNIRENSWK